MSLKEPTHDDGRFIGTTMIGMVVLMIILVTWKLGLWFWAFGAAVLVGLVAASFITGYVTLTVGSWVSKLLSSWRP